MKLNLDPSKFNSIKFIKSIANHLSEDQIIKNIGDSFVKRKATKVTIFTYTSPNNNQLIVLDNGNIPDDICIINDQEIEISEIDKLAPLVFNSINKSSLISLNFYDKKKDLNKSIDINFTGIAPESEIKDIHDNYLKKIIRERPQDKFFALIWNNFNGDDFYKSSTDQYITFQIKMRKIYELRYHKLLQKQKLKILDAPNINIPWKGYDPVQINQSLDFKEIEYVKFNLKYLILPNNLSQVEINTVGPNKSLKQTGGIYFYDQNEILLEIPRFYGLHKKANIPQSKSHLLDQIRIEVQLKDINIKEFISLNHVQEKIISIIKELINNPKIQKNKINDEVKLKLEIKILIKNKYESEVQKISTQECIKQLKLQHREEYHSYIEGLNNA